MATAMATTSQEDGSDGQEQRDTSDSSLASVPCKEQKVLR